MTTKYFNEIGGHYDSRFYKGNVRPENKVVILRELLSKFSQYCISQDIKCIIMHGSLMGWFFNKKILPWDNDIDVCVSFSDLVKLQSTNYFNNHFLLDINPNYVNRETKNKHPRDSTDKNKIDARFICKNTGIYIDITALYKYNNILSTKCPHYYKMEDMYSLKSGVFENCHIYIPNNYLKVLVKEYGPAFINQKASASNTYKGYSFDPVLKKWNKINNHPASFMNVYYR